MMEEQRIHAPREEEDEGEGRTHDRTHDRIHEGITDLDMKGKEAEMIKGGLRSAER